jgi:hypothetical protein
MLCVSDNGATAPISALTYAFSIGSDCIGSSARFGPDCCVRPAVVDTDDGPK